MDALTIDQFRTLIAIADSGGFSAAAKIMNRRQSAITYTIRKLEDQIGLELFDRTGYRAALTEAGRALLPQARRILSELGAFRAQATVMTKGIEPELTLVVDTIFPTAALVEALDVFHMQFPAVRTKVYAENLGAGAHLLVEGACMLSIGFPFDISGASLVRVPLPGVSLVMVAAPRHPLAALTRKLTLEDMRDHVQLVLINRYSAADSKDHSVFADHTWRLSDLGAKHAMLVAGLGFGSLPAHMVAADISEGRLVRIAPAEWHGRSEGPQMPMCASWLADKPLGPAGRWLVERLSQSTTASSDQPSSLTR